MFYLLRTLFKSDRAALWLSLLFAFGTPVFFGTGFLNQNLMLGYFTFMGWITMWNPSNSRRWSTRARYFLGGLAGGTAVLFDYSGLVLVLGLFVYGFVKQMQACSTRDAIRQGAWYILGTLGPVCLLWFYQWKSYGHPFLPGQHWMSPREWMDLGYQGYGLPQLELLFMLALDYRFGLFVSSPLMLLALAAPIVDRGERRLLPKTEMVFILVLFVVFWVFFSGSNYVRLQFNTGMRYMIPMLPFLFGPASVVLVRLPRPIIYFVSVLSVAQSWALAMHRNVEHSLGMLNPVVQVIVGGFQLPWLTTLSRMDHQFGGFLEFGVSPLPLFALTAAILFGFWSPYWSAWK